MDSRRRARVLADTATGLAAGARIDLPDDLVLWQLAGGRPVGTPAAADDPAWALVAAMERALTEDERRQGAHYTPRARAAEVVRRGLGPSTATVVDPACGAGALLLAAAEELVARGGSRTEAVGALFGADVDPVAVAVAEAALALWSGGVAPPEGHLVVADGLVATRSTWVDAPRHGFDAVVGNPPFQGQLASDTVRTAGAQEQLRGRFGEAIAPYVDTAAVFLLVAADLAARGGRVALVQPQSTAASRDAAGVRTTLARRGRLLELWTPTGRPFAARVHVCVPVLEVGLQTDGDADWSARLALGRGVPGVDLGGGPTVASVADAIGGFRRHYYALVGHVRDGDGGPRLVTSGAIEIGRTTWGETPIRFAKQRWARPTVDLAALRGVDPSVDRWLDHVLRPKVVLATQTRVLEAAADRDGALVPCTPLVSVLPHDPSEVDRLAAVLCSPPLSAWAAARAAGTGLSSTAIRTSTTLALAAPLPTDAGAWAEATTALQAGDLEPYGLAATAMYPGTHPDVLGWWTASQ